MVERYAKATARPWKVRDDVTAWATWLSDETEASDIGEIGEGWSIDSMPEAEANAALIVHAVNNIEAAEARISQLEAALTPFAAEAANHDRPDIRDIDYCSGDLNFGDLRTARAALNKSKGVEAKKDRIIQLEDALRDIERRCSEYDRINLVGKTPNARKAGTIRNVLLIARASLRAKAGQP